MQGTGGPDLLITYPGNAATKRAYETALKDFVRFTGIDRPKEFRTVTRAHVIAWRDELGRRELSATTVRHRLLALASLFEYLCEKSAVTHNPVKGVKRPVPETTEGKTLPSATTRPGSSSPRPPATASRPSATARSWRRCCITRCAGTSSASCRSETIARSAAACRI
jgi:hypothetical protein